MVVRAGKPPAVALVDEGATVPVTVVLADGIGKEPGKGEFGGGERLPGQGGEEVAMTGPAVDRDPGDAGGPREPPGIAFFVEGQHGALEDGTGPADSRDAAQGCVVEVADPHPDGEVPREAHAPVGAEVGGGTRLDRGLEGKAEGRPGAEGRGARGIVAENIRDKVGGLGRCDADSGTVTGSASGVEGQGCRLECAEAGKGGVGVGQFEEPDFGISDGEAEAIFGGRLVEGANTGPDEKIMQGGRSPDIV